VNQICSFDDEHRAADVAASGAAVDVVAYPGRILQTGTLMTDFRSGPLLRRRASRRSPIQLIPAFARWSDRNRNANFSAAIRSPQGE